MHPGQTGLSRGSSRNPSQRQQPRGKRSCPKARLHRTGKTARAEFGERRRGAVELKALRERGQVRRATGLRLTLPTGCQQPVVEPG